MPLRLMLYGRSSDLPEIMVQLYKSLVDRDASFCITVIQAGCPAHFPVLRARSGPLRQATLRSRACQCRTSRCHRRSRRESDSCSSFLHGGSRRKPNQRDDRLGCEAVPTGCSHSAIEACVWSGETETQRTQSVLHRGRRAVCAQTNRTLKNHHGLQEPIG